MKTTTRYQTVSAEAAEREGFVPITTAYAKSEYDLLDRALSHMRGVPYHLVHCAVGIEIWRKQAEVEQ
jgi:hypothetical protein